VNALIGDPVRRRGFWRQIVEGPAGRLALAGDDTGARRVVLGDLEAARRSGKPVGIAHIVGAGPGDPDLLTLRAAQLLQEADAILHDETVPRSILNRARRDAEFVAVRGNVDGEIRRRVNDGQTVVRLRSALPLLAEVS
jgi:uroporphyrin-III C-methyltransferase/precorrin-2 dehydrogenase/sirohydrochlorin ferrochelatase